MRFRSLAGVAVLALAACDGIGPSFRDASPEVRTVPAHQKAVVGEPFEFDATLDGTAFSNPRGGGLSYQVSFSPETPNAFTATHGIVRGVPLAPGVTTVVVTATDQRGESASLSFRIASFAAGLRTPSLPPALFAYSDATAPLPVHLASAAISPFAPAPVPGQPPPPPNPITDAGATLGRVLFYDPRLSANDRTSCASCHDQRRGFADSARFSRGFSGGVTARHSMSLTNARFNFTGHFFWDERAASLETQALLPIQDPVEMGQSLENAVVKVQTAGFYQPLFQAAFGSTTVNSDRIARALSQFIRSLTSTQSKFDRIFTGPFQHGTALTAQENEGMFLFQSRNCASCHIGNAQIISGTMNTGLDATVTDPGINGRFRSPSLRNIEVSAPYMHDGRFRTLEEVVAFYDSGVQPNPGLDFRLRGPGGTPRRLNLTADQRAALVAFLKTLTDSTFLSAEKFSDPFAPR